MDMGARGLPGGSHVSDDLPPLDGLSHLHQVFLVVGVNGLKTVPVFKDYQKSAVLGPTGMDHDPVGGGSDRSPGAGGNIHP